MHRLSADVRREAFMRAAVKVIKRDGVAKATTRNIAQEAEMPHATLHYCYRGKEELFFDILDAGTVRIRELLSDIEPGAGLPKTTETLMTEIFEWFIDEPDFFGALFELIIWAWHLPDDKKAARDVYDTWIGLSGDVLRRGLRENSEVDITPLAQYVIGSLDGVYFQYVTYGDVNRARATYRLFIDSSMRLATELENASSVAA
ncbi:TetR/AcrR family transcriptional regulator [Pseudarthrobacter sp. NKDBFgelt]|uniref:TetR/AcrR family transcriptional regulator n=1 Tax=Pseudarthrobacter sp. NKDBFgelt TaxID=3384443 RepID=UPI0038D39A46